MEEAKLTFTDIISYILKKGKKLLIVGIVLAIAFGGFKLITEIKSLREEINGNNVSSEEDLEYQSRLKAYEDRLNALNYTVERYQLEVNDLEKYISESPMLKLDPYNMYIAKTYFSVVPEGSEEFDRALVLDAYSASWNLSDLSKELGVSQYSSKYLKELVSLSLTDNGLMCIIAYSNSQYEADNLLTAANKFVNKISGSVATNSCAHKLGVVSSSCTKESSADIKNLQLSTYNKLITAQNNITATQLSIEALIPPEQHYRSDSIIARAGRIIAGILVGLIGGIVLGAVYYFFQAIMCGKIISAAHFESETGIPVIGIVDTDKSFNNVLACRIADEKVWDSKKDALEYMFEGCTELDLGKTVTIISSCKNIDKNDNFKELKEYFDNKGIKYNSADNYSGNAEAVKLLKDSKQVVLVESLGKSGLSALNKIVKLSNAYGNVVKGAIIL